MSNWGQRLGHGPPHLAPLAEHPWVLQPRGSVSRIPTQSPCSAAACWHPCATLTRRGDPIREVISQQDSSFPCSLPWRHADLDRNSCLRLDSWIPARDRRGPWHPPPHPTQLWAPPLPLPSTPLGLAILPHCCGEPHDNKVLAPSIFTLAHASPPASTGDTSSSPTHSQSPIPTAASPLCQPPADPSSCRYFRSLHGSPRYLASGRRR